MTKTKWLDLQLFADGGAGAGTGTGTGAAGDGGAEGAATGDNAVDAGQKRLLELGVPADKIRKRASKSALNLPAKEAPVTTAKAETKVQEKAETVKQDAAADNPAEEPTKETPTRMSWEEIMADPEYNKQMQAVVQGRLREARKAQEDLNAITPALEVLARQNGLDPAKLDYAALNKAISENSGNYTDKARELGVDEDTAMRIDQEQRAQARKEREEAQTLEQRKFEEHFKSLERQAEELKKTFPSMNLMTELKNPTFARMTSPSGGISVEDAYYAVHRREIQAAAMQATAQKTAEKIASSIQSGQRRPDENGVSGQAPSVTTFDYRNASKEQRAAMTKRIREKLARGEKVYPGQEFN